MSFLKGPHHVISSVAEKSNNLVPKSTPKITPLTTQQHWMRPVHREAIARLAASNITSIGAALSVNSSKAAAPW